MPNFTINTANRHGDRTPGHRLMTVSRAVERSVEPGNSASCTHCGAPVKFVARAQLRQVIANVYVDDTWNRVEHFHADCYVKAGSPYGPAA